MPWIAAGVLVLIALAGAPLFAIISAIGLLAFRAAGIDTAARLKIANQRKIIMEGSQEWEILYRKYYNDEVRKLGI